MARRRIVHRSDAEINGMLNSMMDPNLSSDQLFGIMREAADALDMGGLFRMATHTPSPTRQAINNAKATDDIGELRRLANANLAKRKAR